MTKTEPPRDQNEKAPAAAPAPERLADNGAKSLQDTRRDVAKNSRATDQKAKIVK